MCSVVVMLMSISMCILYPEKLQLLEPEGFYYLSQSGCISDPTINDVEDFASVSIHLYNVYSSFSL